MEPQQPIQPTYYPPTTPMKQSRFSKTQKIIIYGVAILFSVLMLLMVASVIFADKAGPTELSLTAVSARNVEVIRMLDELEDNLSTSESITFAKQTRILLTSDNIDTINYTKSKYGSSYTAEQVANADVQSVITELGKRTSNSDFDEVFISSVQYQLDINKKLLEQIDLTQQDATLNEIATVSISNLTSLLN